MHYPTVFEKADDGYTVTFPDLPGYEQVKVFADQAGMTISKYVRKSVLKKI